MPLTRYMQLSSRSNQLVLLVRGFMSATAAALKEINCYVESFLPVPLMREQRAVQSPRTVECRPGREKRKTKALLANTHI